MTYVVCVPVCVNCTDKAATDLLCVWSGTAIIGKSHSDAS